MVPCASTPRWVGTIRAWWSPRWWPPPASVRISTPPGRTYWPVRAVRELTDPFVEEYNLPVRIGGRLVEDPALEVSRVEARRMAYVERVAHIAEQTPVEQAGTPT